MVRQGGVHEGAGWLSEHRYPPRWITRQKGCYRHRWVERNWPRDGEETDRKGLSRGCELSEHYVRYDAPQHSRSETGGRRHWYRGNGQTCRAYRNSEFWNCRFAGKQRGRLYSQALYRVPAEDFRRATQTNL